MHLAFVIARYFPFGGAQRDFFALAKEMASRGHTISVLTTEWNGPRPSGWDIQEFDVDAKTNHGRNLALSNIVLDLKRENNVDIFIGFTRLEGLDVYFAADESFIAHRYNGLKKWLPRYKVYAELEKALFSTKNLKVLYLTELQKRDYEAIHTSQDTSAVMPVSVEEKYRFNEQRFEEARTWRKSSTKSLDKIVLLFVAKDFHTKGLDRVLKALKQLSASEQSRFCLWVLGDGKEEKYSSAVSSLAVETVFWGGQADTVKYYLAADYLVHPARKEAAGMVIAESLAARLPILVTSLCGYAFLAEDDSNSVILKSESVVDELASHLRSILKRNTLVRGEGSPQIAFKSRAIFCADQIEGWYNDET